MTCNLQVLDELFLNLEDYWAHSKGKLNSAEELLTEHTKLTMEYYYRMDKERGTGKVLDNLMGRLYTGIVPSTDCITTVKTMFIYAVYLHDVGKINPAYQKKRLKNPKFQKDKTNHHEHSIISSLLYLDIMNRLIKETPLNKHEPLICLYFMYTFSYSIARHHSCLESMAEYSEGLIQAFDNYIKVDNTYIGAYKHKDNFSFQSIAEIKRGYDKRFSLEKKYPVLREVLYLLNRFLYALIITCDYYATMHYYTLKEVETGGIENINDYLIPYYHYDVYKSLVKYKSTGTVSKPINKLRCEMLLEADATLHKNLDSPVYYLEAPTGAGKTVTSLHLALHLAKERPALNKVFYVFPFNTLVEQTKEVFQKMFSDEDKFAVVNSINPFQKANQAKSDENYEMVWINRLFMHYPIALTSHVNLFNILFGVTKEDVFPLVQLCNSIIILDEIQSYRNEIWNEMILFIKHYAVMFNMRFIIMSATLPPLDYLLEGERDPMFVSLITHRKKYFKNPLFKNRVSLNFSLLSFPVFQMDNLLKKVLEIWNQKNGKVKILVEFIRKDTAREFYDRLLEFLTEKEVCELTGDDNKFTRNEVIKRTKMENGLILVSTQVIEAGVDIDMDFGFKDISLLDSEEQFLGRINRSCEKEDSEVWFFNLDEQSKVYRKDVRIDMPLTEKEYTEYLENKDFPAYYDLVLKRIYESKQEYNKNNIENIKSIAFHLDYKKIQEIMGLINQKTFQLFIPYKNDAGIDAEKLFDEYEYLLKDKTISYAKKKVELSIISEKMSYFTFTIQAYGNMKSPSIFVKQIGHLFYVNQVTDGVNLIENGKFNRVAYNRLSGEMFL